MSSIDAQEFAPIPTVARQSSKDFWGTHGKTRRPVIIKESVPDWRPAECWTFDYLREAVGHRTAGLDQGYYDRQAGDDILIAPILDAIENGVPIEGYENVYLRNVDLHRALPELIPDVMPRLPLVRPNWMACRWLPQYVPDGLVEFFIGGSGSAFPKLHVDTHGTHAFITQLKGEKQIVAAPPTATKALADAFGDPEKFQLGLEKSSYDGLDLYSATLVPGDTLYVPAGWWHTTFMTTLSISVSTNCINRTNWRDHIVAVTKHTPGIKRPIKRALLSAMGVVLIFADALGFESVYRPYD